MQNTIILQDQNQLSIVAENIIEKSHQSSNPIIISISGGSATGKTSHVAKYLHEQLSKFSVLISQDRFQLGEDFPELNTSKYKWDDPNNFAIDECYKSLIKLKTTNQSQFPNFDIHTVKRGKPSEMLLTPNHRIILFEGLYSHFSQLNNICDLKIYVETYAYARLLRRIFRFTLEMNIPKPETALKQVIDRVFPAHKEFVIQQKLTADYIIQIPYSFQETRSKYKNQFNVYPSPNGNLIWQYNIDDNVTLKVYEKNGIKIFYVIDNMTTIFQATISDTTYSNLLQVNFSDF